MSNTYQYANIQVTEKRTPTDESIKILREMEEKMLNNIISMGKVEDNVFNAKWYIFHDQYSWDDQYCRCVFTLNGKEYDFKFKLPSKYTYTSEIIPNIKEEILKKLTTIFITDLFGKHGQIITEQYRK